MRLKHLHIIGEYKNLKDFKLDFDGTSFIDVFVGKNGTGKSNLFEAIIEIFRHLFNNDYAIRFDYLIKYEIKGGEWEIRWQKDEFKLNGGKISIVPGKILPDNIIIYYSGHNEKISELVNEYEEDFKSKIKKADINETREFIGIGKEYKSLLLSVLLLQKDINKAKEFICKKLGIAEIDKELVLTLRRPYYATSKTFDIVNNDDKDRFWKPEGITRTFLERLKKCQKTRITGPERREGYLTDKGTEEYVFYYSIEAIQDEFADLSSQELFRQFDNLKTIEMLGNISINLKLENGTEANINNFSDGQFQTVYIYSIIELFKDKNCLTILDEPDAFLHPEWQFDFFNQLTDISAKSSESNHLLMSSHSAITLIKLLKDRVRYFDFNHEGNINAFTVPKRIAIDKLSEKLIKYSEHEQILSIINTIQIEKKPVFFTEGKTDPIIIKEAWYKLNPEKEIPFIPFYAFGHKYLAQLMKDPEVIKDMEGLPIFGLFDFDKAFNTWNGFSEIDIIIDPYLGLIKQMKDQEVYAIMLPVPKDKPIEKQVINIDGGGTFGENAVMAIEHLFSHLPELEPMFVEDKRLPSKFKRFHGEKVDFAKVKVPTFPDECFEVFKPIFDFIESKIPNT